ncbi:MAG: hypothetical protein JEZ14_06795 [Marinilabiliaceae bacterium]|nr:hypothetical protein [Marinilabiliaceae bacterium]
MISLFNLQMVARYESKILLRSWFFRIFSGVALSFIIFFNLLGVGALGDGAWPGRLLPSGVPYMNMFLLNLAQAIIAVFLSADFLGRDKKLDTTEAFYVRSISNIDYVIGKTLGIIKVFFFLNVAVLLVGVIGSLIGGDSDINVISYLLYPILISLPSLVFVLGLSYFTMSLVRNQAITFVLILGVIALLLFYVQNKWYGLLDFLGFYTSFIRSDFAGFDNVSDLFLLRGGWLFLGLFFILATVWRLPRLSQQKFQRVRIGAIMSLFLIAGVALLGLKLKAEMAQNELRLQVRTLNENLKPIDFRIQTYDIELNHTGNTIDCLVKMKIAPSKEEPLPHLSFALNPGLQVKQITIDEKTITFEREGHLVHVQAGKYLSQDTVYLQMAYQGRIREDTMFPEIIDEVWIRPNRMDPLLAGKRLAYIQPEYVLLTREANWYPVIADELYYAKYPFSKFELKVTTQPGLKVIAQGHSEEPEPGQHLFKPLHKLNALSLTIGHYEMASVMVDSVQFNLYHHPDHDYFKLYFELLNDTVAEVLTEIKGDYERKLGLSYPFEQLSLVETPISFYSYLRNWSLATENIMPEMIFFPEKGGGQWSNDFDRQTERTKERNERQNMVISDKELQVEVLKSFIGNSFIQPQHFRWGRSAEGERQIDNWGRYQLFPNYFAYANNVEEEGYPLLNIAIENYLHKRQSETRGARGLGGLSSNDEVILKLRAKSLNDLITTEDVNVLGNVFASKGSQLFSNLKVNLSGNRFDRFLDSLLLENRYQNQEVHQFIGTINNSTGLDFRKNYSDWLNEQYQPAYLFGTINVWEVKDGNRIRYFMKVPLTNGGEADGIISFTIREGMQENRRGRGRFRSRNEDQANEQNFMLKAGQSYEIGFLLDQEPREVVVNTYLAANIPSNQRLETGTVITDQKRVPFYEGLRDLSRPIKYAESFETIVDNEDTGCEFVNTGESRTLKDWWISRQNEETEADEYGMIRFWNPPVKWKPVAGGQFFGEYLKSAFYKRRGSGNGKVIWTADLKQSGNYDVYAHVPATDFGWRRHRDNNSGEQDYLFTVSHDDGDEEVSVTISKNNSGWIYLGDYYCSQGAAKVQLSDQTNGDLIIGDAVKWVKK